MHGLSHYSSSKLKKRNRTSKSQSKTKGTKSQTSSIKIEHQNMTPSPVRQRSSRSKSILTPAKFIYERGPPSLQQPQQELPAASVKLQLSPMQSNTTFDEEPRLEWDEQTSPSQTKIFSESTFAAFEDQSNEYLPAMSVVPTKTTTNLTKSLLSEKNPETSFNTNQNYSQETNTNGFGVMHSRTPPSTFSFGEARQGDFFESPKLSVPENEGKRFDAPNLHKKSDGVSKESLFTVHECEDENKEDGEKSVKEKRSRSEDSTRSRLSTRESEIAKREKKAKRATSEYGSTQNTLTAIVNPEEAKQSESAKRTKKSLEKRKKRSMQKTSEYGSIQSMLPATGNPEGAKENSNKQKRNNHKTKKHTNPQHPGIGDCIPTKPPVRSFPFNKHRNQKTTSQQLPPRPKSKQSIAITEAISKTTIEEDSATDDEEQQLPPLLPVTNSSTTPRSVLGTSKHAIGACFALTSHALLVCFVLAQVGGIPTHEVIDHVVNATECFKIVPMCQGFLSKIKASKSFFTPLTDSLNKNLES